MNDKSDEAAWTETNLFHWRTSVNLHRTSNAMCWNVLDHRLAWPAGRENTSILWWEIACPVSIRKVQSNLVFVSCDSDHWQANPPHPSFSSEPLLIKKKTKNNNNKKKPTPNSSQEKKNVPHNMTVLYDLSVKSEERTQVYSAFFPSLMNSSRADCKTACESVSACGYNTNFSYCGS